MRTGRTRYVSQEEKTCHDSVIGLLFFIFFLSIPFIVYKGEVQRYDMTVSFQEAQEIIREPSSKFPSAENVNKLIHLSSNEIQATKSLMDPDFYLAFDNSLRLKRETEYCQWSESYVDTTWEDSDGHKHTERTYFYVKIWSSHLINSFLFNQPFAHHNPQRDPYPSYKLTAKSANVGGYSVLSPLIENLNNFSTAMFSPMDFNSGFRSSDAFALHKFSYVGGGYFYSPYLIDSSSQFVKWFGEFLEGSLLDFQVGDLFSQCTAGDIRIRFTVVPTPESASIVGKQIDEAGTVGSFVTSNEYSIALMYEGIMSAEEMFTQALQDHQWTVWGLRALMFLWSCILVYAIDNQMESLDVGFFGLCVCGVAISFMNLIIWGPETAPFALGAFSLFFIFVRLSLMHPAKEKYN